MTIITEARACTICKDLPLGPRPVFQISPSAKILIAAQAPGIRVHESGRPFTDPSGDRLRDWMGITREQFYEPELVAIMPMGFCYPGRGTSGDLPPRKECARLWHQCLLDRLPEIELTLLIGGYAQAHYLPNGRTNLLTTNVVNWRDYAPAMIPLPHPSPRNNGWLKHNPWFTRDLLPTLRQTTADVLRS